jgi:hypothetical protein
MSIKMCFVVLNEVLFDIYIYIYIYIYILKISIV